MMFDYFVRISRIGRIIFEAAWLPDGRLLTLLRGPSLIGSLLVVHPLDGWSLWCFHGLLLSVLGRPTVSTDTVAG